MNSSQSCLAYLGMGANLGDPIEQIINAKQMLFDADGIKGGRCSSFYLSSPVGYDDQPSFINCVLELEVSITAIELLSLMQRIEIDLGRTRVLSNQNAPRLIDVDLLLFGDQTIRTERLIVPHPRMAERLFVLKPLLELCANDLYQKTLDQGDFVGQQLQRLSMG